MQKDTLQAAVRAPINAIREMAQSCPPRAHAVVLTGADIPVIDLSAEAAATPPTPARLTVREATGFKTMEEVLKWVESLPKAAFEPFIVSDVDLSETPIRHAKAIQALLAILGKETEKETIGFGNLEPKECFLISIMGIKNPNVFIEAFGESKTGEHISSPALQEKPVLMAWDVEGGCYLGSYLTERGVDFVGRVIQFLKSSPSNSER